MEENKIEEKKEEEVVSQTPQVDVEEQKEEMKKEEKIQEKKCCGFGLCKNKKDCKKFGMILGAIVLIALVAGSFAYKQYRQKNDIGADGIKVKLQKFVSDNVPSTVKTDIKDVALDGQLYKATIVLNGQDVPVYVTRDGKKFIEGQSVRDLDKTDTGNSAQQAQTPEADKEIPKNDKPNVDLYVMAFCPFGNKSEDTIKSVYNLLKNKVNFNFHYIVSSAGSEIKSLHGPKEVTQDEREACVLKTYGKDKWMSFVTYVNAKCGSDGSCWEDGAKSLGINSKAVSACVDSQGLALMQQNEKDSTAANAGGSPTMTINGVSTSAVYKYGNSELYKQTICSAFSNQPKECQTKLEDSSQETAGAPAAACGGTQQ